MNNRKNESGNVVFFVLLAVVLLGLVTAALRTFGIEGANIDKENLLISASSVRQYASELERAVSFILRNNYSEVEIRFAHPDAPSEYGDITSTPGRQVFDKDGGGAEYRAPSSLISGASSWEFYGHTRLPEVGSDRADLIAVLPDVTVDFCERINKMNGYDAGTQPNDPTGDCIHSGSAYRFSSASLFTASGSANQVDEATFTVKPSQQGCVQCPGPAYHFFHVLLAR